MPCSEFCAGAIGIDRLRIAGDDTSMERVLDIWRSVGPAPQALGIALVLGEQQLTCLASIEVIAAEHRVIGADRPRGTRRRRDGSKRGPFCTLVPGPGIAKAHARQQVKARRLGPPIARFDP